MNRFPFRRTRERRVLSGALLAAFGWAAPTISLGQVIPPEPPAPAPAPLSSVPVPLPDNLGDCVTDMDALLKLGKALFWDEAFGSDGKQACASCHFAAGADPRAKNQVNPGTFDDNTFDTTSTGEGGPNTVLSAGAWPFHKQLVPDDNESGVVHDYDDAFASQGIKRVLFTGVNATATDDGTEEADPDGFAVGGFNVRRVEPRNTPSVINKVFIHRLFWDGRANHFFNGADTRGNQNQGATVLVKDGMGPAVPQQIMFNNAALASQGVGPPDSPLEMSWDGRTFDDIGKKMVGRAPLETQEVHPLDSVLGPCANPGGDGLTPGLTYRDLIEAAFDPKFWCDNVTDFGGFSQTEKNFSLFAGLALLRYQSTLIADQTPFDLFLEGGGEGGTASSMLTDQEKEGMDIFMNRGECAACHGTNLLGGAQIGEPLLELMAMENTGAEACVELVGNFGTPLIDLFHPGEDDEEEAEPVWTPPEPVVPPEGECELAIDPRGQLIEIAGPFDYATGDYGTTIVSQFLFIPGTGAGVCHDVDIDFPLVPWSGVPYGGLPLDTPADHAQEFGVEVRFRQDSDCNIDMKVCLSTGFPGIPSGKYTVWIGGQVACEMDLPDANPPAVYDNGFYNIGTTPTMRDPGNGDGDGHGPFAIAARVQNGEDVGQDTGLAGPLLPGDRIAVNGAFRAPGMRNLELTGPYMHNGGLLTPEHVVDFYTGGAHFFTENLDDLDPEVAGIGGMDEERKAALAAFLKRPLTDERVRWQQAPFDHPELRVANGHGMNQDGATMALEDECITIPAVGADGAATPLLPFHAQLVAAISIAPQTAIEIGETAPPGTHDVKKLATAAQMAEPRTIFLTMPKPPQAPVFVTPIFNSTEIVCVPRRVKFGMNNWASAKKIQVFGVMDGVLEGDEVVQVSWRVDSQDEEYAALVLPDCDIMVHDVPANVVFKSFEAEDAVLSGPMQVINVAAASGGQAITVPNGTGLGSNPDSPLTGRASLTFEITPTQAANGPVYAWVLEHAASSFDNATWVRIDETDPWEKWIMQTGAGFNWDQVNNDGSVDPTAFTLSAGTHTLHFAHNRDGAVIDRIVLTNDASLDPTSL